MPARLPATRFSGSILPSSRPTTRRRQTGESAAVLEPIDVPAGADIGACLRITSPHLADGIGLLHHRSFRIEKLLHQLGHNGRRTGLLQVVSGLDRDKAGVADARRK